MSDALGSVTAVTPDLPLALRHLAPRVVVVGDAMLDRWWVGSSSRLSREAPAPVMEVRRRHDVAGGHRTDGRRGGDGGCRPEPEPPWSP